MWALDGSEPGWRLVLGYQLIMVRMGEMWGKGEMSLAVGKGRDAIAWRIERPCDSRAGLACRLQDQGNRIWNLQTRHSGESRSPEAAG